MRRTLHPSFVACSNAQDSLLHLAATSAAYCLLPAAAAPPGPSVSIRPKRLLAYFRKKMLRFFWEARKFATKFIRIGVTPPLLKYTVMFGSKRNLLLRIHFIQLTVMTKWHPIKWLTNGWGSVEQSDAEWHPHTHHLDRIWLGSHQLFCQSVFSVLRFFCNPESPEEQKSRQSDRFSYSVWKRIWNATLAKFEIASKSNLPRFLVD